MEKLSLPVTSTSPRRATRKIRDGWLHTGDSGYRDADGHLFVLGRREGMIKRGGGVIAPRELEEVAQQAPGVRVAAAISLPADERNGDEVVVVVESDVSENNQLTGSPPTSRGRLSRRSGSGPDACASSRAGRSPERRRKDPPRRVTGSAQGGQRLTASSGRGDGARLEPAQDGRRAALERGAAAERHSEHPRADGGRARAGADRRWWWPRASRGAQLAAEGEPDTGDELEVPDFIPQR